MKRIVLFYLMIPGFICIQSAAAQCNERQAYEQELRAQLQRERHHSKKYIDAAVGYALAGWDKARAWERGVSKLEIARLEGIRVAAFEQWKKFDKTLEHE